MDQTGWWVRIPVFASLRHRDYRRLFFSTSCAGLAMWTLIVGRGWLVYHLTGSSGWVGVVTFAGFLPFMLGPIGGVLADRYERRRLAAVSVGIALFFTVVLALLTAADAITAWQMAILTLVMSLPRAAELPARQALIANVVPEEDLLNAISLSSVATFGTRAVGPAIVIPLIDTIGAGGVFFLAAGFYAVSILLILQVDNVASGGATAALGAVHNLKEGVAYILATPMVAALMFLVMFHCALTMSFDSLLPVFAVQELDAGGSSFSALAMGVGAGALLGTLLISGVRDDRQKGKYLLVTAVLSGIAPMAMALPMGLMSLPVAFAATMAMGATQGAFIALSGALIQAVAPDRLRGRVSSLYLLFAGGLMAWVNLLNGALADVWDVPLLFLGPSALYVAILCFMVATRVQLRGVFRLGNLTVTSAAPLPLATVETA